MPKKGYKQSPEHLERNRLARIGKKASEETKEKMRLAHSGEKNHNFGKKFSEETRKKISESKKGENHPLWGKHRTDEVKKAIGDAHRGEKNKFFGKPLPEDVKEKIRAATSGEKNHNYGKPMPEEVKAKIAAAHFGMKTPEDTRIKMHEAQKGEKAHAWKGGISYEPYCPKFNKEFKERVRAFFGYKCQICGHVWKEGEHIMAVHHVNYHKNSCCDQNVKPLFVPLCFQPCHTKTNHDREMWQEYFTDIINNEYGGKCYYTFEEMREKKCGVFNQPH
jgi:hypothetical protein